MIAFWNILGNERSLKTSERSQDPLWISSQYEQQNRRKKRHYEKKGMGIAALSAMVINVGISIKDDEILKQNTSMITKSPTTATTKMSAARKRNCRLYARVPIKT